MHLTRQSRNFVSNYCHASVYHHLIVEFECEEQCIEENIKDTAMFYQKLDNSKDWLQTLRDKNAKFTSKCEKCSPLEGPLITVNNSENQMIHSVTARGVQGLLQTVILGVLSSPAIKHRVFYFSRVSKKTSQENIMDIYWHFPYLAWRIRVQCLGKNRRWCWPVTPWPKIRWKLGQRAGNSFSKTSVGKFTIPLIYKIY